MGCSRCRTHHGWIVIITTANCISLFLSFNSMKYHQSGLETNTIFPSKCGPILTVWHLDEWNFLSYGSWKHLEDPSPLIPLSYVLFLSTNQPHPLFFRSLQDMLKLPIYPVLQCITLCGIARLRQCNVFTFGLHLAEAHTSKAEHWQRSEEVMASIGRFRSNLSTIPFVNTAYQLQYREAG